MCGICGHLTNHKKHPVDHQLIERMNTTLRHRGPDDVGYYINLEIGMGMSRLAIIDVAGGQQPISNENGTIVVVFNGEIYNFQELRSELEKFGHHFSTQSDTEVIVHAYEQWGDDALMRFNGMFAFSLWDDKNKRLLLARDRMGQKPLYWHYSENGLLWGSELKALLSVPWVEREIDIVALHHYLTLQYTPDPLTIFKDIYQLPAAHKLVIKSGESPQISRWWQLKFEPKWELSQEEVIEKSRLLLLEAVRKRLISEVPFGAFLSGGIDSSIIVALMSELSTEQVSTFTIGFEEKRFSEADYARQVAEFYKTDHYEFNFRPEGLIQLAKEVINATDEPFADPAALPLYELSRHTRKYVTVALCGDGGDETLAGYQRYALDGFFSYYSKIPDWITQSAIPALAGLISEPGRIPEDRNPIAGLKRLKQFSDNTEKASLVRWGSYFSHDDKLALYNERWRDELGHQNTASWIANAYDKADAYNHLDRTLFADHETYLSGDLLPKTDRMTMAHSLEGRAPFLDPDWVIWAARLPTSYKVKGLNTKRLLKMAFGEMLPPGIASRGKQGFSVPVGLWIKNELNDWTKSQLLYNPNITDLFYIQAIEGLFSEHESGKINHGKRIWALLMFALWQEVYI